VDIGLEVGSLVTDGSNINVSSFKFTFKLEQLVLLRDKLACQKLEVFRMNGLCMVS
jgi:hypothetical protein